MPVIAFLPCRSGSKRVKNKNIKSFAGYNLGLFEIKINQLINSKNISKIIVSTDVCEVLEYLEKFNHKKIEIDERPKKFCSNTTTTDELIEYASSILPRDNVLWTHVTSPFANSSDYDSMIKKYINRESNIYDSLMTVKEIKSFIWDLKNPYNYSRKKIKWPFTQNIESLYEINNGGFIAHRDIYEKYHDRIGKDPEYYILDSIRSIDIDTPEQFDFANKIFKTIMHA